MKSASMSHRSYRASALSMGAVGFLSTIPFLSPAAVFAQPSPVTSDWQLVCSNEIVVQTPSGEVTTAIKQTNIMVKQVGEILVSEDSEDFRLQTTKTFDPDHLSFSTSGPADGSPGPYFEINRHNGNWMVLIGPYVSPEKRAQAIAKYGKPPRVSVIVSLCDEL